MIHKTLAVALLMAAALTASAQKFSLTDTDDYSRLDLLPNLADPIYYDHGLHATSHMAPGIGIGYLFGINVTGHSLPLFLEVGPEVNYNVRFEEVDTWDDASGKPTEEDFTTRMLNVGVPLNVVYKVRFTDAISLAPFAGLNAKFNLLASTYRDGKEIADSFDDGANRFQMGWNAGVGIYFNRFYVGQRFSSDITPFLKERYYKLKYKNYYLSFGVKF